MEYAVPQNVRLMSEANELNLFKSYRLRHLGNYFKKTLLDRYFWQLSRKEFLERLDNVQSVEDAVELTWQFRGVGFYEKLKPNQDRWELTTLANRVHSLNPQVVVEIGTRFGGTLFVWSQCSEDLHLLVSIDLPGGIHGGGYPVQRGKLYNLFTANRKQCRLELIRGDSQKQETEVMVAELLRGRPIDFLFIDGDHRLLGVKRDYELYAKFVRPGGLIAFHDICPNPQELSVEVFKLWNEIASREMHTEEIIHTPFSGRFGIGLLRKA